MKEQLELFRIFNITSSLNYFEIQNYYQNEPKLNGVYSRNNLLKIKDGVYVINLDEYKSIGMHWIALCVNGDNRSTSDNATYFDSFVVEHILKEISKFIGNRYIITKFFRIQAFDSIMCGYFCIGFVDFMLQGKSLLDYTNLFSPNEYEKNDTIILKYFQ